MPVTLETPYCTTLDWQKSVLVSFERGFLKIELPAPLVLNQAGRVQLLRDPGEGQTPETIIPQLPPIHAMRAQATNLVAAIRGEPTPLCEAPEALEDLRFARDYIALKETHHMKPSQLAINSVSTRHPDLETALAAYSAAGFEHVEFVLPHVKEWLVQNRSVADFQGLLRAHDLTCIGGFETSLNAFSPPQERAANRATHMENARLLEQLGARVLVVGTDGPNAGEEVADPLGELAAAFAEMGEAIRDTGVQLCIEFNWSPFVKSLRTAVEVARRSGASNVGVLFDPAHYHCTPSKFEQLTRESVPFIKHVHVDDMRDKPGEVSNCNSDRVLPGEGCLDLKALFGRLEEFGYTGFFSIEMFSDELWNLPAEDAAKAMFDSLLPLCD